MIEESLEAHAQELERDLARAKRVGQGLQGTVDAAKARAEQAATVLRAALEARDEEVGDSQPGGEAKMDQASALQEERDRKFWDECGY